MVSNFSVSGNFLVFRANIAVPKVCSIFFHAAMATTKHQKLEGGGGGASSGRLTRGHKRLRYATESVTWRST